MNDLALRTVGLGKMYRIGAQREQYRTMRGAVVDAVKRPIERLRHPGAATHVSEDLWALRDIDLELEHGDVLGVIGRNGSGKSTLLKVLSHITHPTEGRAEVRGRVASLLEVGTGFHPELTGRENITLNGSILGMTRAEIRRRFDEIVEFSEIGRFLDTPVKRYSSGMYVRLAFAVAAHLDPEILIVDEVLAVGDADFQRKCLGKMNDVARGGRTVLFVSHNLSAISSLCSRAALLDRGRLEADGGTEDVISQYLSHGAQAELRREWTLEEALGDENVRLLGFEVGQTGRVASGPLRSAASIDVTMTVKVDQRCSRLQVGFELFDDRGVELFETYHSDHKGSEVLSEGLHRLSCTIPSRLLNEGRYLISPVAALHRERWVIKAAGSAGLSFDVALDEYGADLWKGPRSGALAPQLDWQVKAVGDRPCT